MVIEMREDFNLIVLGVLVSSDTEAVIFVGVLTDAVLTVHRFTDGEYKERGLGDVKILRHTTSGKLRLLLRREKIHKLACNHMISADMNLRPMDSASGKAWIWYAVDFAEGNDGTEQMFAIR